MVEVEGEFPQKGIASSDSMKRKLRGDSLAES
jgi:hypothetical protein